MMVKLEFINPQITDDYANPGITVIECSEASVNDILAWYGAYYAGDDYEAYKNGKLLSLDINGEFEPTIIDVKPSAKILSFNAKNPATS